MTLSTDIRNSIQNFRSRFIADIHIPVEPIQRESNTITIDNSTEDHSSTTLTDIDVTVKDSLINGDLIIDTDSTSKTETIEEVTVQPQIIERIVEVPAEPEIIERIVEVPTEPEIVYLQPQNTYINNTTELTNYNIDNSQTFIDNSSTTITNNYLEQNIDNSHTDNSSVDNSQSSVDNSTSLTDNSQSYIDNSQDNSQILIDNSTNQLWNLVDNSYIDASTNTLINQHVNVNINGSTALLKGSSKDDIIGRDSSMNNARRFHYRGGGGSDEFIIGDYNSRKKLSAQIKDFDANEGDSLVIDVNSLGLKAADDLAIGIAETKRQFKTMQKDSTDIIFFKNKLFHDLNDDGRGLGGGHSFAKLDKPEGSLDTSIFSLAAANDPLAA